MKFGSVFLVLIVLSPLVGAQVDSKLMELAKARLQESESPGRYRDLAISVLLRSREDAALMAEHLADRKDWHDTLTAMAIWSRLGADTFVEEAILKRKLDEASNMAISVRSLELMIGNDASALAEKLPSYLDHSLWLMRRAALQVVATSETSLQLSNLDAVLRRLDDPIEEIRNLARSVMLDLSRRDAGVLCQVLQMPWWGWDSARDRRALVWAVMDGLGKSWDLPLDSLQAGRADSLSRFLGILVMTEGPERIQCFIELAHDPSHSHLIGDDLVAAMASLLADDLHGLQALALPITNQPALHLLAKAVLPRSGRRFRLAAIRLLIRVGFDQADAGGYREEFEEKVLIEAFEQRPNGLAEMLDELFLEFTKVDANRRRCRRVLRLRAALNVPIEERFLFDVLNGGTVAQRVVMAEHVWLRGDAQQRLQLKTWLKRLQANDPAREPVLGTLLKAPNDDLKDLVVGTVNDPDLSERLRLSALDVVIRMNWPLDIDSDRLRIAPDDLRLRLIEYELRPGGQGAALLREEIGTTELENLNLAFLRLASRCRFEDLDKEIRGALREGRFSPRSLPAYLDYIETRFGMKARELELNQFLESSLELSPDARLRSGFAQLDGKVIEHLLQGANPKLPLKRLFGLALLPSMREPDRVVAALAELAERRGQESEFHALIRQRWTDMDPKASLERASLARELILHGDREARSLVAIEAKGAIKSCVGKDLLRDEAYSAAVMLEWIFQALVESSDAEAQKLAIDLLSSAEEMVLREKLEGWQSQRGYEPRNSMTSAFVAELREQRLSASLSKALMEVPALKGDPTFWNDLSRQILRFPAWGSLDEVAARGLLSWPPNLHRNQDHVLRSLGLRLMRGSMKVLGAELYLLGRRLERARVVPRIEDLDRILAGGAEDRRSEFWNGLEAELLTGKMPKIDLGTFSHRRSDESRFLQFLEVGLASSERAQFRKMSESWKDSSELATRDRLMIRLSLDDKNFEEARLTARHALGRIAVFGSSGLYGQVQVFTAFEAAALWGLGRQDEARVLLKSIEVENLSDLEGPVASDFN